MFSHMHSVVVVKANLLFPVVWWVDFSQMPTFPAPCLLPLLDRTEGENRMEKLEGDKTREITYQLLS